MSIWTAVFHFAFNKGTGLLREIRFVLLRHIRPRFDALPHTFQRMLLGPCRFRERVFRRVLSRHTLSSVYSRQMSCL